MKKKTRLQELQDYAKEVGLHVATWSPASASSLLRKRVLAPECGARSGIFAAWISRFLRRCRAAERRIEYACVFIVRAGNDRDHSSRARRTIDEA